MVVPRVNRKQYEAEFTRMGIQTKSNQMRVLTLGHNAENHPVIGATEHLFRSTHPVARNCAAFQPCEVHARHPFRVLLDVAWVLAFEESAAVRLSISRRVFVNSERCICNL